MVGIVLLACYDMRDVGSRECAVLTEPALVAFDDLPAEPLPLLVAVASAVGDGSDVLSLVFLAAGTAPDYGAAPGKRAGGGWQHPHTANLNQVGCEM